MTNENYNKAVEAAIKHRDSEYVVAYDIDEINAAINCADDEHLAVLQEYAEWLSDNAELVENMNTTYDSAISAAIKHRDGKYVVPSIRETIVDALAVAGSPEDKALLEFHLAWVDENKDLNDILSCKCELLSDGQFVMWDHWYAIDAAYKAGIIDSDGKDTWDYLNDAVKTHEADRNDIIKFAKKHGLLNEFLDWIDKVYDSRSVLDNHPDGYYGDKNPSMFDEIRYAIKDRVKQLKDV